MIAETFTKVKGDESKDSGAYGDVNCQNSRYSFIEFDANGATVVKAID